MKTYLKKKYVNHKKKALFILAIGTEDSTLLFIWGRRVEQQASVLGAAIPAMGPVLVGLCHMSPPLLHHPMSTKSHYDHKTLKRPLFLSTNAISESVKHAGIRLRLWIRQLLNLK